MTLRRRKFNLMRYNAEWEAPISTRGPSNAYQKSNSTIDNDCKGPYRYTGNNTDNKNQHGHLKDTIKGK
jgi:hypothetical protein